VKSNRLTGRVKVSADGTGLVSRAGALLLRELTVDTGLAAGWTTALLDTYKTVPTRHAPSRVVGLARRPVPGLEIARAVEAADVPERMVVADHVTPPPAVGPGLFPLSGVFS